MEFTHKSFAEYLTSKRIVRAVEEIDQELRRNKRRYGEGQALIEWAALTGHTELDADLHKFLCSELELRKENALDWQESLCGILNYSIKYGISLAGATQDNLRAVEEQSRNAVEALFAALYGCARQTGRTSKVTWLSESSAGGFYTDIDCNPQN